MNSINQLRHELRKQPMLTWTSILGSALSIFMIMTLYIAYSIPTIPIAPESNRPRMMIAKYIHIVEDEKYQSSGSFSHIIANKLYSNLDGVERMALIGDEPYRCTSSLQGGKNMQTTVRRVDHEFWNIMNFDFLYGAPFAKNSGELQLPPTVITDATAQNLFGNKNPVGKEIIINTRPYRIAGVVKSAHPILSYSFADAYLPYRPESTEDTGDSGEFGQTMGILLLKPGVTPDQVREEVKSRYAAYNSQHKSENKEAIYHGAPFELDNTPDGSNQTPDDSVVKLICWFLYAVMLLLPAINLNAMTRSRLRSRVAEIGLHRAFGATRRRIAGKLLFENLILTLLGGVIGLLISILFMSTLSNFIFSWNTSFLSDTRNIAPPVSMIFSWKNFFVALLGCLVLNLLSAGIPALKGSRMNPAQAIHGAKL